VVFDEILERYFLKKPKTTKRRINTPSIDKGELHPFKWGNVNGNYKKQYLNKNILK